MNKQEYKDVRANEALGSIVCGIVIFLAIFGILAHPTETEAFFSFFDSYATPTLDWLSVWLIPSIVLVVMAFFAICSIISVFTSDNGKADRRRWQEIKRANKTSRAESFEAWSARTGK